MGDAGSFRGYWPAPRLLFLLVCMLITLFLLSEKVIGKPSQPTPNPPAHYEVAHKSTILRPSPKKVLPGSSTSPLHWIFLQYHKTGHDFTQKFSYALLHRCHTSNLHDENKRKNNMEQHYSIRKSYLTKNDVYVTVPGAFAGNWSKVFQSPGHVFRIVHFVRDPFDLILSAYLFHTEVPAPEQWITLDSSSYCSGSESPQEDFLRTTAPYLGAFHGDAAQVRAWITAALELCSLSRRAFHPRASYQTILYQAKILPQLIANASSLANSHDKRSIALPLSTHDALSFHRSSTTFYSHNVSCLGPDLYPAIRIQALHSLFSHFGDLLHMAVTKLFEEPRNALSVSLRDFAMGNRTAFRSSARRVLSFLLPKSQGGEVDMPPEMCEGSRLCSCFQLDEAVDLMEDACYVDEAKLSSSVALATLRGKTGSDTLASHVTAGRMPSEVMQEYKARLAADPILGPLLSLVARIVSSPSQGSLRLIDTVSVNSASNG